MSKNMKKTKDKKRIHGRRSLRRKKNSKPPKCADDGDGLAFFIH
jgi:hypothetical protein